MDKLDGEDRNVCPFIYFIIIIIFLLLLTNENDQLREKRLFLKQINEIVIETNDDSDYLFH